MKVILAGLFKLSKAIALQEYEEDDGYRYMEQGMPRTGKGGADKFLMTQWEYDGIVFEKGTWNTYRNRN